MYSLTWALNHSGGPDIPLIHKILMKICWRNVEKAIMDPDRLEPTDIWGRSSDLDHQVSNLNKMWSANM
jgi:hypothetical protein